MTAVSNAVISVSITDPNQVTDTTQVQTDANGAFAVDFTAAVAGDYLIGVAFAGDATYAASSNSITVTVEAAAPIATAITLSGPTSPVAVGTVVSITGTLGSV
jgi:uncharacterized protein YfaS (alpha-2-macroglobulin family)